jgi:hypothetical protein
MVKIWTLRNVLISLHVSLDCLGVAVVPKTFYTEN